MKPPTELTDSGLGAGEAAVFRDQVGVVALAGQNLEHVRHFLAAALLGAPVHSESDVCSLAGKVPPGGGESFIDRGWPQRLEAHFEPRGSTMNGCV